MRRLNLLPKEIQEKRRQEKARRTQFEWVATLAVPCLLVSLWPLWRWATTPRAFREVLPIDRLDTRRPDFAEVFLQAYHNKLPVVLTHFTQPADAWTLERLKCFCPTSEVSVYEAGAPSESGFAGLQDRGQLPLPQYVDTHFAGASERPLYALEMTLRSECPQLLEDVRLPPVVAEDMLPKVYPKSAWPTLILGPRGTRSHLHRDTHDLPFFLMLARGSKRWRVFAPDSPISELYHEPSTNGFMFDVFAPDFWNFPALGKAQVHETVLVAGEMMYIPMAAPHGATNLEDTVAYSVNFLDPASYARWESTACASAMWRDSSLCYGYALQFQELRADPKYPARTFFEIAGFPSRAAWCESYLPELRRKAERYPDRGFGRKVVIVDAYCNGTALRSC